MNDDLMRIAIVAACNVILAIAFQKFRKKLPRERINAAFYSFGHAIGRRLRFLLRH